MIDVMVVDDEYYVRLSVINRMDWQSLGLLQPRQAENGIQAMQLFCENPAQIIITDIRMPGMDGLDLISQIQEKFPDLHTQFIILSGYADFEYARTAMRLGVTDFLLKPVDVTELTKNLQKCINAIAEQDPDAALGDNERIAQIKAYIHNHLDSDLKLEVIAKKFYISPSYLSALFKKNVGQVITNYIENARMQQAKIYLENADMPVSEIADRIGYNDQAYFSKVFKRTFGLSPKQYQQKQKEK